MWRDLTSEPVWKYEELPPLLLVELTKLDLFEVGDSELARAQWFWSRRRKLALHATAALGHRVVRQGREFAYNAASAPPK
jgi:hypothetical protein